MNLYALFRTDENNKPFLLTITAKKNEAKAYARCFIRFQKIEHFKLWCQYRNLDYTQENNWDSYMNDCLTEEDLLSFRIKKLKFNKLLVAENLRVASNCLPIGLPYESDAEYSKLAQIINLNKNDTQFIKDIKELSIFNKKVAYILTNLNIK